MIIVIKFWLIFFSQVDIEKMGMKEDLI